MIFEDIEVPIPQHKRIAKKDKGHVKSYVYEVLQRKGPNSPKDVVQIVGVAISDTMMHPNENYFDLHPEYKVQQPMEEEGVFDSQIYIGSSILLREASRKLGLKHTLEECFPGYSEVIQTLVEYYMLERDSTAQLYKYYLRNHYTEMNYIPSETTLSKIFNEYLTRESIAGFLSRWMKYRLSHQTGTYIDIDYDSTNFNVNSETLEAAEHGKAKVDEGLPQINVAYFIERSSGIPVYYDIYYGSIIDMEHCRTAVNKLREINAGTKFSFVMDRGYFSSPNLQYMEECGYRYLCMGKSTKEFRTMMSVYPYHRIVKAENRIFGNIYGVKERRRVFQESSQEYYVYFYYNMADIATALSQRQDYVEEIAKDLVGKKDSRRYIRNTYGGMVNIETDDKDVITACTPKYEEIDKYRDECGYFWIVSNEDLTPSEALLSYRHRDIVEKTFKGIKSGSDLNKVYSSTDSAFEAKNFLAFLTSILRAEITTTLKPYYLQYSGETSQTVLKEMEKIKVENLGKKYDLRYALTNKQKQILSFYELTLPDVREYVSTVNRTLTYIEK